MKRLMLVLSLLLSTGLSLYAQTSSTANYTKEEQELVNLSKDKWQWMADKDIEKLAPLFHDESKFVHMSGTWKKTKKLKSSKQEVSGIRMQTLKM